jgi:Lrp/AsnC family leucine-responsive transcriptional regulator
MDIVHLDRLDRKILALLQEDGRLTNNDLAEAGGAGPNSWLSCNFGP